MCSYIAYMWYDIDIYTTHCLFIKHYVCIILVAMFHVYFGLRWLYTPRTLFLVYSILLQLPMEWFLQPFVTMPSLVPWVSARKYSIYRVHILYIYIYTCAVCIIRANMLYIYVRIIYISLYRAYITHPCNEQLCVDLIQGKKS